MTERGGVNDWARQPSPFFQKLGQIGQQLFIGSEVSARPPDSLRTIEQRPGYERFDDSVCANKRAWLISYPVLNKPTGYPVPYNVADIFLAGQYRAYARSGPRPAKLGDQAARV